uniref:MMS19 nucleotide excision repair protein n=1 Tax=Strigamia maritima TaxID=126957 RepID=T1JH66_STRMM
MSVKELIERCVDHLQSNDNESTVLEDFNSFQELSNGLHKSDVNLLQIVECLEPQLTDVNVKNRVSGVCLFAQLLHRISQNQLNLEELSFLITFCADRLKDQHLVIPYVIRSLVTLTSYSLIPKGCSTILFKALFQDIQTQTFGQSTRQGIYIILSNLVYKCLDELQEVAADFILGFIQAMDGEKDPRSLMILFKTIPFILKTFRIGHLAEEFFEVISCYFPIDFSPPSNNPHGVTKEDLILTLRNCLAATPVFGPFCLPLLIEKLDSSIIDAKIDALQTLNTCCETYDIIEIRKYFTSIWSSIRREIFLGANENVETEALAALTALIKSSTKSVMKADGMSILDEFLEEICSECQKYLCEPELKLMHPSARILQAAAHSSDLACQKVLLMVIPLLMQQYNLRAQLNKRKIILDILNAFLIVCRIRRVSQNSQVSTEIASVVNLYMTLLSSDEEIFCESAIIGFDIMLQVPDLLSSAACNLLIKHFLAIALTHPSKNIRNRNSLTLRTVATLHTDKAESQILPKLFAEIATDNCESTYHNALAAVTAISVHDSVARNIIPVLIKHLNSLLDCNENQLIVDRLPHAVSCLNEVIKNKPKHNETSYLCDLIIVPLINKEMIKKLSAFKEHNVISQLSSVFGEITKDLPISKTRDLLENILFPVLFSYLNSESHATIQMINSMICSAPSEAFGQDIKKVILQLDKLINDSSNETVLFLVQMIASIVNKCQEGLCLDDILNILMESINSLLVREGNCESKGLVMLTWLTKALVLRGHPSMEKWISRYIQLLSEDRLGQEAANGFEVITSSDAVLTVERHAIVRIMYRQRFYQTTISKLMNAFNATETNEIKSNHLIAILHQLQHLPQQVLFEEINSLIPLLSKGLISYENINLLLTTLTTLKNLINTFPLSLTTHITTLIPHFLRIAQNGSTLKIRMAALHCLNASCEQPTYIILPLKSDVVKGLTQCLGDKKRLVRQVAVITRGNWFLVGAPGGSK